MKENAILKINQMGKISSIVTTIAKVITGIGIAGCLFAAIVFAVIPEEFMTMTVSGDAVMDVNLESIGISLDEEENDELQIEQTVLEEADAYEIYDVNGTNYLLSDMTMTEDTMQLTATSEPITMNLHNLVWVMIMAVVSLGMTMVTLFFIGALCKAFRNCASPFEENVTKKMQNLAISLVPWAFMTSITDAIAQSYFTGKIQLAMSIDLHMVLIILLIFVLVYIFKYGAVLQRESDETL